jgi:hypothetical protein
LETVRKTHSAPKKRPASWNGCSGCSGCSAAKGRSDTPRRHQRVGDSRATLPRSIATFQGGPNAGSAVCPEFQSVVYFLAIFLVSPTARWRILKYMKLLPLISAVWLAASCPSWAVAQEGRFLEFKLLPDESTTTYDLNTVHIIQPGRFTVMSTTIDAPDVLRFELKALDTLRDYCARPYGKYPPSPDLLMLGPPDMPVQNIEVKSIELPYGPPSPTKYVEWKYPYRKLALLNYPASMGLHCDSVSHEYSEVRNLYINGVRAKKLYDCRRGLEGNFSDVNDDPTKAIVGFVPKGTVASEYYLTVCRAVTHEEPFVPK